ncbi:MAG: trimethylamine methyltransferase family protein [Pseudomonadota bacterium]
MTDTPIKRRSGGRSARVAKRAAPPVFDPAPAGQVGGQYCPLTPAEVTAIYDTALRLLAELGMGEVPGRLRADLSKAGANERSDGRVTFDSALVEDAIAKAAKSFWLHGIAPDRSIQVGGKAVHFGTGGAAVQTLDSESGVYRPSTLRDLHDFTRLQDTLDTVSWFTRCCVATDVPDIWELDINTAFALVKNTTKPTATAFTVADHVAPIVGMFDMVVGGDGFFANPNPKPQTPKPI